RFIKPLDRQTILAFLQETNVIITLEDGVWHGGMSTGVIELLKAEGIENYKILPLGVPEEIVPVASREELLHKYRLDAAGIYDEIKRFLTRKE
ncbi:MAG: 1-deoxy-D-xylulose-5-phosphate synthase, partial [Candidatus Aminicenantes bacterium]|nr:1-deoxy-D-xylulose-5-phosphate synthase [Candidatus Aminicenantes bacterium]